jgi:type IV pilus assembly protein PilF
LRPTPRSLLIGIRIARATGERDTEASYALQLKGLYPESDEYRTYQAMPPAR